MQRARRDDFAREKISAQSMRRTSTKKQWFVEGVKIPSSMLDRVGNKRTALHLVRDPAMK
jgi:hypothetical protein